MNPINRIRAIEEAIARRAEQSAMNHPSHADGNQKARANSKPTSGRCHGGRPASLCQPAGDGFYGLPPEVLAELPEKFLRFTQPQFLKEF